MKTLLLLILSVFVGGFVFAQKTVQFRISQVYSDVDDMDGFGAGDSDPQWNYEITDNFGINDGTNTELSGTDCPFWQTLNDQFFSQQYDCQMPANYTFVWRGLEDDGIGSDANTGNQTVVISGAAVNLNQTNWTSISTYTATAGGDNCSGGGTVTWRVILQYRVLGGSLCNDECTDPYSLITAQEYVCGPTQTTTALNVDVNATAPATATDFSYSTAGITCTIDGSSPEDIWVSTQVPPNSGGVTIQFENEGGCTGFLCQTNITYAWYTSSDGTCAGLEYRGCDAVSCFLGCSNGEITVSGYAGETVWVRIWEEDDQGFNITINQIVPTAPADLCYTVLPLSGLGCNYGATSPPTGLYAEPDIASWVQTGQADLNPLTCASCICQDGDSNPLTNTVWLSNENLVWYEFTTTATEDFNLAVTDMVCSGGAATVQMGVWSQPSSGDICDFNGSGTNGVQGYGCSVGVGNVQLTIPNLPAGDYILLVDGNAGAQCDWTFAETIGDFPLPVEFVTFEALLNNNDEVELRWSTASEQDNDFFTIERSKNGLSSWEFVTHVDAIGNSSQMNNYSTKDKDPMIGVSYYRLKQTDFDGQYKYFTIKVIENIRELVTIFPNPAKNQVNISSSNIKDADVSMISSDGQIVQLPPGIISDNIMTLDISSVPNGVYFIRLIERNQVVVEKFVVNK